MKFSKKSGKKKAAAAAVVCFVAAIAITGTYTFNDYKKLQNEKELAMAEEDDVTKEKYTVTEGESVSNEVDTSVDDNSVGGDNEQNEPEDLDGDNEAGEEENSLTNNVLNAVEEASVSNAANVNFSSDSMILWPVSGALLMDYSMDKTVYFKTLDQYKYNPALVIAAAENDQIIAGASGLVKSVDNTAQTGLTVNVDLGNGYEAFYGQLQKVSVKSW